LSLATPNLQTVYELSFQSFPWATTARPLLFVLIGLLLIRFLRRRAVYQVMGFVSISAGIIFSILVLMTTVPEFMKAREEYASGKTIMIEGIVHDFVPAPSSGIPVESFKVGESVFTFETVDKSPCFHNASPRAGIIQDGQFVRINYFGDCIQKIQVRY
jgi:hypothetical protein